MRYLYHQQQPNLVNFMSTKPTNAQQFVADLGAGTFANQLGAAISMVSQGAVQHNKKGQIKITLDIARIGDSSQVENEIIQEFKEKVIALLPENPVRIGTFSA